MNACSFSDCYSVSGVTTSGMKAKARGRIGDSALPGSGLYAGRLCPFVMQAVFVSVTCVCVCVCCRSCWLAFYGLNCTVSTWVLSMLSVKHKANSDYIRSTPITAVTVTIVIIITQLHPGHTRGLYILDPTPPCIKGASPSLPPTIITKCTWSRARRWLQRQSWLHFALYFYVSVPARLTTR